MRYRIDNPRSIEGAAVQSGHVGLGSALVEEDQPPHIQALDLLTPCFTLRLYVGPVLLCRVQRLFFRRQPSRFRARCTAMMLAGTWERSKSSANVAPGSC